MDPVIVKHGSSPIVLGFPHTGTYVPPEIEARLNDNGRLLADTDWYVDHLYDGLLDNATTVKATFHRYVIDANRDPSGVSLYPGQNTTGLVPKTDFDGEAIWNEGDEPLEADIATRLEAFHRPYHAALAAELERLRKEHGIAILYDCHSIRSHISFLFEGKLPDFNIGTNLGVTCAPEFEAAAENVVSLADGFTHAVNGRFKGGWTTRHYGKPETGIHAIQMELAQSTHLATEEPPFAYDGEKAEKLRVHLQDILERIERLSFSARM
ncbi:N-formylglutamate deformylase [Martelella mediterranea]|uniref:Formiminoglutamase n=1 Tax=Martelella mediterranea TaxID=293089 RepID=A0A4V2V4J6_9HYPH|nr:N-formylglutamate deformylase [Martelella mediterranea]TCT40260.1 formiminoglutamase [Martelella mediterranea]